MSTTTSRAHLPVSYSEKNSSIIRSFGNWIRKQEPLWEQNRLGIAAAGILIQVSIAGVMILILGAAGASPLVYTIGILLAFMADSLAFAQAPMRWVLAIFTASCVVNLALSIFYGILLL